MRSGLKRMLSNSGEEESAARRAVDTPGVCAMPAESQGLRAHRNRATYAICDIVLTIAHPRNCANSEARQCNATLSTAAWGVEREGGTRLRGPEVLGPLRGLRVRPLVSAIWGLGNPFPGVPWSPGKALRAPERLFRGLGDVCSFQRTKKQGGPLRGL